MNRARAGFCAAALACALALSACATQPPVNKGVAADANANLGADFLRKGDIDQAETYFRKALNYDDRNFSATWGMAVVNDRLGHAANAKRYYKKALDLRASPQVFNSYAAFLCQHGQVDQGVAYFKRAAGNPPYRGRADALANAGLCLQRAHREKAAIGYYRKALTANPSQVVALVNMARLEYAHGHYLNARAFLERADSVTDLDPEQLLLGARIELALNDRQAAESYVKRHNASRPAKAVSLSQLEQSRS